MTFLRNLPASAKLLDVLRLNPEAALPLLDYHEAVMRRQSPFTVAEREMLAAFVSAINACGFCQGVHEAAAARFGMAAELLEAVVTDVERAAVEERFRPILRVVSKLTRQPAAVTKDDTRAIYDAGWDDQALHDAVAICGLFNMMNRVVEGLGIRADASYASLAGQRLHDYGYAGLKALVRPVPPLNEDISP